MRTQWISVVVGLLTLPAVAAEVNSTSTARRGNPVRKQQRTVRGPIDPADLTVEATPRDVGDPVMEVDMDKDVYEAGEAPTLTVRVHRRDGRGVEDATVAVDDEKHSRQAGHRGKGEYQTALDNAPGEHVVDVNVDAVVDGNSVHRAVTYSYMVATGHLRILGLGPVRQDDTYLYVPLRLRCTHGAFYQFEGTLVSKGTEVAWSQTTASLPPGATDFELRFALVDLVEPGPYTLTDVSVQEAGPTGLRWFATAPGQVGTPFAVQRVKQAKVPKGREHETEQDAERDARTRTLLGPGPIEGAPPTPQGH